MIAKVARGRRNRGRCHCQIRSNQIQWQRPQIVVYMQLGFARECCKKKQITRGAGLGLRRERQVQGIRVTPPDAYSPVVIAKTEEQIAAIQNLII